MQFLFRNVSIERRRYTVLVLSSWPVARLNAVALFWITVDKGLTRYAREDVEVRDTHKLFVKYACTGS